MSASISKPWWWVRSSTDWRKSKKLKTQNWGLLSDVQDLHKLYCEWETNFILKYRVIAKLLFLNLTKLVLVFYVYKPHISADFSFRYCWSIYNLPKKLSLKYTPPMHSCLTWCGNLSKTEDTHPYEGVLQSRLLML